MSTSWKKVTESVEQVSGIEAMKCVDIYYLLFYLNHTQTLSVCVSVCVFVCVSVCVCLCVYLCVCLWTRPWGEGSCSVVTSMHYQGWPQHRLQHHSKTLALIKELIPPSAREVIHTKHTNRRTQRERFKSVP